MELWRRENIFLSEFSYILEKSASEGEFIFRRDDVFSCWVFLLKGPS